MSVPGCFHQTCPAYGCFPTTGCAHDPAEIIRMAFQREGGLSGTHAILTVE